MQLRDRFSVFRVVGELLGCNDVVETCNANAEIAIVEDAGTVDKVLVVPRPSTVVRHIHHHIQVAGLGSPVGEGQLSEKRVDLDREGGRVLVGKTSDAKTRVELS